MASIAQPGTLLWGIRVGACGALEVLKDWGNSGSNPDRGPTQYFVITYM